MDIKYGRKRSGIKREIQRKIKDWTSTIDDESIIKIIEKDAILTGGAIASMLLGERINDWDFYFRTKESTLKVAEYYVKKFNESKKLETATGVSDCAPKVCEEVITNLKGAEEERVVIFMKSSGVASDSQGTYHYFENQSVEKLEEFAETLREDESNKTRPKYRPVFLSQNAITLSDKIQLVIRFYGEPCEIHDNYDFAHAKCYYDKGENLLHFDPEAMEAMLSRTLIYRGSLYPIASIFRMKKFIERGWRITAGQQLKIMWQIAEIDMTSHQVLREQLTGVDQAYMIELIKALKNVEPEKINSSYVGTIIDRIFD